MDGLVVLLAVQGDAGEAVGVSSGACSSVNSPRTHPFGTQKVGGWHHVGLACGGSAGGGGEGCDTTSGVELHATIESVEIASVNRASGILGLMFMKGLRLFDGCAGGSGGGGGACGGLGCDHRRQRTSSRFRLDRRVMKAQPQQPSHHDGGKRYRLDLPALDHDAAEIAVEATRF